MEELSFKIVKIIGEHDEVLARVGNLMICHAAFEKALFVIPMIISRCGRALGSSRSRKNSPVRPCRAGRES
jgi:hypothetical protein